MMKALVWHGKHSVSVDTVPEPRIKDPKDVIVRITSTAICGSDLHLYDGMMPTMEDGDIIGHEPMGEVVEVGAAVTKLKKGDGYGARRYGPVTRRTVWIFTHARVPYADVGPIKVPEGLRDEQVLFLSDIFPTGYTLRRLRKQSSDHEVRPDPCTALSAFADEHDRNR